MKNIDLLVSFDTTGSMYPVLSQVRSEVQEFVKDMFSSIENLRIGIIAHGDYCDKDDPYTIRVLDFTTDQDKICEFVKTTKATSGGDVDECYELVLNTAREVVSWRPDSDKIFILIGDANPHSTTYRSNTRHLDWNTEAKYLGDLGIRIYAVHALSYYRSESTRFYQSIADYTNGTYLTLDQFREISSLIKATALSDYSEEKISEYISIIRDTGNMTHTMARNINRLVGRDVVPVPEIHISDRRSYSYTTSRAYKDVAPDGLVPVAPGRFQTFTVDEDCDIRKFITDRGIAFAPGRGFYELTKYVKVQQHKEIILQDRTTGEMFHGSQVREKLGLKPQTVSGGVTESLSSKNIDSKYKIFVQSTSYNRKLLAGTDFLYEVEDV